jgi:hypothetical protein
MTSLRLDGGSNEAQAYQAGTVQTEATALPAPEQSGL